MNSADCQRCVKATLTLILIYFRGRIRVIMKIEIREIKFSQGVQTPTRTPEKIVVGLFSGILVNSGILVEAGRLHCSK